MLPRSWITKELDGSTTLVVVKKEGSSFVVETTVQSSAKEIKKKAPEMDLKANAKLPATKRRYLNPASNTYVSYARAKQLGII
jgi:hypothetical protein